MTKLEQVYDKICGDNKIKNMIKNQVFQIHLREDFYQEIILKLLEFENKDLLIDFYEKGILERFIIKMCKYSLASTKIEDNGVRRGGGDFYIKYIVGRNDESITKMVDVPDTIDLEKEIDGLILNEKIDKILFRRSKKDLDKHYHNTLFSMFRNGMSYAEISETTGVNYHSVRYSIQKTIKMLRSKL
ncbi:hypothetical protein UFOVP695_38 [uncultured Caudovirales phage]|uniref:Uncharacterized protein n=1 Tax=uncultured Caudovirales phage TaxID=2100421 RepID=A0A6J5NMG2_9CAUD|nr:hypothetical protein UFOVP695_38 [uncultured Caudovirales phage]